MFELCHHKLCTVKTEAQIIPSIISLINHFVRQYTEPSINQSINQ